MCGETGPTIVAALRLRIATVIETLDTSKKSWEDKTAFSAKS